MNYFRYLALLLFLFVFGIGIGQTQGQDFQIYFGETQSAFFDEASLTTHTWFFLCECETMARQIPIIRANRIAGQFTPRLRLLDSSGAVLAESTGGSFADIDELIYSAGLPDSPVFQIEVSALNIVSNQRDNPAEYSLTVEYGGTRRARPDEGLNPLPDLGLETVPNLREGESERSSLGVDVFGAEVTVTNAQTPNTPSRFLVTDGRRNLYVNQNIPIAGGVHSLAFLENGIGVSVLNQNFAEDRHFFSDEGFTLSFNDVRREYTFTLESGTTIISDFYRVQSIEVREGIVAFRMILGDSIKRMLFNNSFIDSRQLPAGENETALNQILFENGLFVTSDLQNWETLAYFDGELQVFYGADARFRSDSPRYFLRRDAANPELASISKTIPVAGSDTPRRLTMTVDWRGLGDIRIAADLLYYELLNGVVAQEIYTEVNNLLVENGAAQFSRRDGSFRTIFPDGTDINSPSQLPDNVNALPNEIGFRSRNFNDLGEDFFPLCPCVSKLQQTLPVNPVNGNFFYKVSDFNIPSAVLPLEFTRYYNSMDAGVSPRYLVNAPVAYARLGNGWRHSYQHELDIAGAPLGRIRYVEPDGTQHYFFPVAGNPNRWTSRTLLSTVILREGGILGTWQAIRTDGLRYYFDRVGRLTRISLAPDRSISLSSVPLNYASAGATGLFVVEPYGRRLELYIGDSGRIETVRDSAARQIRYRYDESRNLTGVEYITPTQTAGYEYNELGLLARFNDVRSPYTQTAFIEYDAQFRTIHYVENPDESALQRDYQYSYEQRGENRISRRTLLVGGQSRVTSWIYNALFQMTALALPQEGWNYEFTYDENTGTLASVRTPTLVRYLFFFDSRGNLVRYEDPFFTGERAFNFSYEQRGERSILTRISHPNGRIDNFGWSAGNEPLLTAHETLVFEGAVRQTRTTRFEYDSWGRMVMQVDPANVATIYLYDSFGYVENIWQGIQVTAETDRADITDSNSAWRTLQFDYDLLGQVRAVTDGRGGTYTLNWDSSTEQLRQVNGPDDVYLVYSYDERGHVISVDDRGQETVYTYNGLGLVTSITDSQGSLITFDYDEAGNLLRKVDDLQREWVYRYDVLDNLIEARSPNNIVSVYETTRSAEGDFLIRREIDPEGRFIERRYDALGRLRLYRIEEPQSAFVQEFSFTYDTIGYPIRIEDTTTGRAINLEYNLAGEVTAIDVAGSRTSFDYDARGFLGRVTSPEGRIIRYSYNVMGDVEQVILPDGSSWDYSYDENGNLLSANDPTGIVTSYIYDALNQLVSEEDALGNIQTYSYDLRGNLTTIIDPRAISRGFRYDSQDRLLAATDGRAGETSYEYDEIGRLINIVQPGVRSTRLTYDLSDNIIAVTERPREQRTLYSYDNLGRITSITDPLGHTTSYTYNPVGRLAQITNSIGNSERFEWRPGTQFLIGYTDTANRSYSINTDALGRATLIREASTSAVDPINTQLFYDDDGYITGIQTGTDSARSSGTNDIFHRYEYSPNGYPVRYIDPTDGVWNLRYDSAGRLLEVVNPNNVATRYVYDEVGRIRQIIHNAETEAEAIESYEYDQNGNIIAYVSPSGVRNEYLYNQNNRLIQATLAVGTESQSQYLFEYNTLGQLFYVSDPLGRQTRYYYSLDELIRVEQDFGEEQVAISYDFDDAGNLRTITLPQRVEDVSLTYDALNRPVRYVNGESNTWSYSYDAAGNIAQISDPLGSVVGYSYDSYNRVTRIQYPSGSVVTLTYDTAGNLRSVTLPPNSNGTSQTITYRLDVVGNIQEMQIGGSITRYEYDDMGNITSRIAPDNSRTEYEYDAANRLTEIRYPNGTSLSYGYDAEGNLLNVGDTRFEYDAQGHMTLSENSIAIRYRYDALGNLIERDAGDLGTTTYTYDQLDRLERVDFNGESIQLLYTERSQISQIIRSNGVQTAYNYDAAGRPISVVHIAGNERLDGFNYQYDAVGNLIRVDRIVDQYRVLYSYDLDHRLIGERWLNEIGETEYSVSFRYDLAGNRIEEIRNGRVTRYSYDAENRLIEETRNLAIEGTEFLIIPSLGLGFGTALLVARRRKAWWALPALLLMLGVGSVFAQSQPQVTVSYSYDSAGNMNRVRYVRSDATYELNLSYDAENRLIAVQGTDENGNAVDTTYSYDQFSRMVNWRSGERSYEFYYDGRELIGMSDGSSLDSFLTLDNERILTLTGGETLWNLNDQLGSTRRYTNAEGQLLEDPSRILEFNSFGLRIYPYSEDRIPPEGAPVTIPSPFAAGNLYDPSTRLYLMGLRAYDPITGRFLQADPIRQDPVGTLYTFARNRPFVFNDETGMVVEPYVEPLRAAGIDEQIEPESLIPRPSLPDFPIPPAVHRQQADETFRALELLQATYYGSNETVGLLSPLRNNFYMNAVNPIPDEVRNSVGQPLENLMAIYQLGDGWIPEPRPNPTISKDPFDLLLEVQPLLSNAYSNPMFWCFDSDGLNPILPVLPQPEGLNSRYEVEAILRNELQPLSLASAVAPEAEVLLSFPPEIQPNLPVPLIDLPFAPVEPPVLESLDELREESFGFISRIWGYAACENCVPDLGFGR